MRKLLLALPFFLMITACDQGASAGDPSEITARSAEWDAAINAKDVDAVVAIYTDDARVMAPNRPMTVGSDGVRAEFGGMIEAGLSVKLTSIDAVVAGDVGHNIGTYTLSAGDTVVDVGKFIETWARGGDGVWRISNDIYNSDNTPAGNQNEHLVILHEVDDADHWTAAWRGENSRHNLFEENGAAHVHTFRSVDNPHLTGLVVSVSDMAALQTMIESDEGVAAAEADGVRRDTIKVLTETE
ncbi:MAG: YybH family protein [Woeseiaceae bacterium]